MVDYVWKNDRFNYGGQYLEVGEHFNAEMGYIPRLDIRADKAARRSGRRGRSGAASAR